MPLPALVTRRRPAAAAGSRPGETMRASANIGNIRPLPDPDRERFAAKAARIDRPPRLAHIGTKRPFWP